MRTLPPTAVFTRTDLRRLGWTDSSITRAIHDGRLVRLRRGRLARAGGDPSLLLPAATISSITGSVLSHRSALAAYGLPVVGARPSVPEITVVPGGRGSAHAALLHRAALSDCDVALVDGIAVTSPARTLMDVARSRPVVTAVAALDSALNRGLVAPDGLDDVLTRCWNWPYIARAQQATRRMDGRAESALESVSRLAIANLRLPTPQLQALVRDNHGIAIARLDFYWDEFGVAGEADGRGKYDDRETLWREKEREDELARLGLVTARWGWDDAWRHPQRLRERICAAFARGTARDRSGSPREWSITRAKPAIGREVPIEWSGARKR